MIDTVQRRRSRSQSIWPPALRRLMRCTTEHQRMSVRCSIGTAAGRQYPVSMRALNASTLSLGQIGHRLRRDEYVEREVMQ